jgi:hypothetical protein
MQRVAREWYAKVVAEIPGCDKLHHHLGLLSREAEGVEARSSMQFITLFRGKAVGFRTANFLIIF